MSSVGVVYTNQYRRMSVLQYIPAHVFSHESHVFRHTVSSVTFQWSHFDFVIFFKLKELIIFSLRSLSAYLSLLLQICMPWKLLVCARKKCHEFHIARLLHRPLDTCLRDEPLNHPWEMRHAPSIQFNLGLL